MLLGVNYKNEYGIRRKAYHLDNPVCNAGLRTQITTNSVWS